jgi:hypothetical protein
VATSFHDPAEGTFELPPEQAMVVANEDSPVFLGGTFETIACCYADHDSFVDAFRAGAGVGWHQHDDHLFSGVLRLSRPGYAAHLVKDWLPGPGRPARQTVLRRERRRRRLRTRRLDDHLGAGVPALDLRRLRHPRRLDRRGTRRGRGGGRAAADEVRHRLRRGVPGTGYDVGFMFDCLPRPRRPDRGCASGQKSLAPDGTLVLLEPRAGDRLEDNLNPVGRTFYGLPTMICTPNSLSQEVGRALGAQAGEVQLRAVLSEAGFTTVRPATETPFNLILDDHAGQPCGDGLDGDGWP